MNTPRPSDIAAKAIQLILTICGKHGVRDHADLVAASRLGGISPRVHMFANYVVAGELGNYVDPEVADQTLYFTSKNLHALPGGEPPQKGFISWLYRLHSGGYVAVFNEVTIRAIMESNDVPATYLQLSRVKTRLFYHELSHFVLHGDFLINRAVASKGYAMPAQPLQEEEAWLMASVFLGAGVGGYAHNLKQQRAQDFQDHAVQRDDSSMRF